MALIHGKASSYRRGCRCDLCKQGYADDQRPRQHAAYQRRTAELAELREMRDDLLMLAETYRDRLAVIEQSVPRAKLGRPKKAAA